MSTYFPFLPVCPEQNHNGLLVRQLGGYKEPVGALALVKHCDGRGGDASGWKVLMQAGKVRKVWVGLRVECFLERAASWIGVPDFKQQDRYLQDDENIDS